MPSTTIFNLSPFTLHLSPLSSHTHPQTPLSPIKYSPCFLTNYIYPFFHFKFINQPIDLASGQFPAPSSAQWGVTSIRD